MVGRKCCIPNCKSNYGTTYVSVFRFPKEEDLRALWLEKIPRDNYDPSNNGVVCVKHFEEDCVITHDILPTPEGDIRIPRGNPKLKKGTYPTIFPASPRKKPKHTKKAMKRKCTDTGTNTDCLDTLTNGIEKHPRCPVPMARKCSVAGCRTNYGCNGPYLTTFKFPVDEEMKTKWLRCVNRVNFIPGKCASVCINHFEEQFIKRDCSAVRDDGTILSVRRIIPVLKPGAFPTIFKEGCSHLTKRKKALEKKETASSVDHNVSSNLKLDLATQEPGSDHEMAPVPQITMKEEPMSEPEDDSPCLGASTSTLPSLAGVTSLVNYTASSSGEILGVPVADFSRHSPPSISPSAASEVSNSATNGTLEKNRFLSSMSSVNDSEEAKFAPAFRSRDQFDVYGEYIASKLRRLDWRTCAHVQKAFGDIIFDAEMGKYS